jgi:ferredoxin
VNDASPPPPAARALQRSVNVRCVDKSGALVRQCVSRGGLNLWAVLRKNGVPIGAACSGVGVCAACSVRVSPSEALTPQEAFERESLANHGHDPDAQRLACLCRVLDDVTVSADYW